MDELKKIVKIKDWVLYFKKEGGFDRVLDIMRKRWEARGSIGKDIQLDKPTKCEIEALSDFFGRSFSDEYIEFKISEFIAKLSENRKRKIDVKKLLESYFNEEIIMNKERRELEKNIKNAFFNSIINIIAKKYGENAVSLKWINSLRSEKQYGYRVVLLDFKSSPEQTKEMILNVSYALEYLEALPKGENVRLSLLGAYITSKPHYFDKESPGGKLLLQALSCLKGIPERKTAEEIFSLYTLASIKPDDISSFTTLYGVRLYTQEGRHMAYDYMIKNSESYLVSLANLNKITYADCKTKKVFILENQMVFSYICDQLKGLPVSMLCTSGQSKTATLIMIDLLCKSGCELFYSGDLDPEGLLMADKILLRHPESIKPWRIKKTDYHLCISNENLDKTRIKKLNRIYDERIFEVCNEMRIHKKAGYQEMLIEEMIKDIKKMVGA